MARSIKQMNEDELRETVTRLRREKRRLKGRLTKAQQSPAWFEATSIKGGSVIRLEKAYDAKFKEMPGMVHLTVGETCVYTVNMNISVQGLACLLTYLKDKGMQTALDAYLVSPGALGSPEISLEKDTNE